MMELIGNNNFIGFDKYTNFGAYHWDSLNNEYIAQSNIIIEEILKENPASVLDIGCGDAAIAGRIGIALPAATIYGFDAEKNAIILGTNKIKEHKISNVFLKNCNINEAKDYYRDIIFEAVFSLDVIEHLPNPTELIDFIKLTKAKNILIGTPLFIKEDLMSPYHVKEYTKNELLTLIGSNNIIKDWVLSGKRKSKTTGEKFICNESYYICSVCFN